MTVPDDASRKPRPAEVSRGEQITHGKAARISDLLLKQVSVMEISINRVIVAFVAADNDLAFEILTDSVIERLNSDERRRVLHRILDANPELLQEVGLQDDELDSVRRDLKDVYKLRNTFAHAALVQWQDQHNDKGPGCQVHRVRKGQPVQEFHLATELDTTLSRANELTGILSKLSTILSDHARRRRAIQKRGTSDRVDL